MINVGIIGYGYWGKPSTTVITQYNQIFFNSLEIVYQF